MKLKAEKNRENQRAVSKKKIDKSLARLIKDKRRKAQITNIRNETENLTADPAESKRIRKECCEHK
jgi:hypothetical protein